ncbi:MAG: hypothetical protein ACRC5H_09870, partial [Treponemataceae bacterium]
MKLLRFLFFFSMISVVGFSQEAQESQAAAEKTETITIRPFNSTADEGFYWDNAFRGRWSPFGAAYRTKIYYRDALMRDKNSFWFANSAWEAGIEQEISSGSRTSAFIFWQPIIAVNFLAKVGYFHDFVGYALLNDPNDDYSHALPPFTGLNPLTRKPVRSTGRGMLEFEFSPTFTFGGKLGNGMLALIYN